MIEIIILIILVINFFQNKKEGGEDQSRLFPIMLVFKPYVNIQIGNKNKVNQKNND